MKKIFYTLFLSLSIAISCDDDKPLGTQSVVQIKANISGISDIGYVKTWVMNTVTLERQWVTLTQLNSTNVWEGEVTLENGDYSLETLVQSKSGEPFLGAANKIAYVQQLQFKVIKNITTLFENFNLNTSFKLHDFEYHTILTSSDPCDLTFKIYIGKDLSESYVYLDRWFWDSDMGALAYSFKEVWIRNNNCIQFPDDCFSDSGVITGAMRRLDPAYCTQAVEGASLIDAMIRSSAKLGDGHETESFDFVYYKYPQDDGGKVGLKNGIIVRKKFLPESVLKQIE